MSGISSPPVAAVDAERDFAALSARLWRRTRWIHLAVSVVVAAGFSLVMAGRSWPYLLGMPLMMIGLFVVQRVYRRRIGIPYGGDPRAAGGWLVWSPTILVMVVALWSGYVWRGNVVLAAIAGIVCCAAVFAAGVLSERRQLRADLEAEAGAETEVAAQVATS